MLLSCLCILVSLLSASTCPGHVSSVVDVGDGVSWRLAVMLVGRRSFKLESLPRLFFGLHSCHNFFYIFD